MTELAYPSGLQPSYGGPSLQAVRDLLDLRGVYRFRDLTVEGLAFHSGEVRPGTLFFAIPGHAHDGADFVDEAIKRGAVAVVAEKAMTVSVPVMVVDDVRDALAKVACYFYSNPSASLPVIGVTGTNGKTTVAHLIRHCLETDGKQAGLLGTIAYEYAGRRIPATTTTPDAVRVQGYLREMADRALHACVMEVSSHALTQSRVRGVDFKVGVFLNLTPEHLDYHKDMRSYANAKAELFRNLSGGGIACLNIDDPASEVMYAAMPDGVAVRTFGRHPEAHFRAENVRCSLDGSRFTLCMPHGKVDVNIPLVGEHNVDNAVAAAAAVHALGVSELTIATALEIAAPPRGRLELVGERHGTRVFVDYAHTPDALSKVCGAMRELGDGPLSVVFGCGGDRDKTKRPEMARIVGEIADKAYLTSDNPRSEDPEVILDDMAAGLNGVDGEFFRVSDRADAIERAVRGASAGETVLIAGKGHEAYQAVGDTVVPFDDVEVARAALDGGRRKDRRW